MADHNIETLRSKLEAITAGANLSKETAGEIEVLLDTLFPRDDHVQQTVEMLALFQPGGGDHLFNENQMLDRLRSTQRYLFDR